MDRIIYFFLYFKPILLKDVPPFNTTSYSTNPNPLFRRMTNKIRLHRNYTTKSDSNIINYDSDKDKLVLLDLCKNKSGIYMWTNKFNNKKYIGSSVNLRRRLLEYYNVNRLLSQNSMAINRALLKYGYSSFTVNILEICDIKDLVTKEKDYFEIYSPEYNILKIPGSPSRGSGWKHSEATKEKMRLGTIASLKSLELRVKLSLAQKTGTNIMVTNVETNIDTIYPSIKGAARALSIDSRYIQNYIYLKQDKPVLGLYTFKLLIPPMDNIKAINQKRSQKIQVLDVKTKQTIVYPSISSAARSLGLRQASISLYLKENRSKPFRASYVFKLVS